MSVFLAGGGSARQEAQVWGEAFAGVGSVLYWPFALPHHQVPAAESWFRDSMRELGITAQVDTWTGLRAHEPAELDAYDLLFVGGGRTSRLAREVLDHGFGHAVRTYVRSGGRYYGGSAGAILACERVTVAALVEDDAASHGMTGLGLLTGWSVLPHGDKVPPCTPAAVCEAVGADLLVLSEASGVVLEDGAMRAIGPDSVRVLSRDGSRLLLR